jgi:DNA-binding CsgD family transcriptional regulator
MTGGNVYTDFLSRFFNESNDIKEVRFSKDLDGRFQYANQHFCDMIHYFSNQELTKSSLIGKKPEEILPPKAIEVLSKLDEEVIKRQCELSYFTSFNFKKHTVSIVVSDRPYYRDNQLSGILTIASYLNFFNVDGRSVMLSPRELDVLVHMIFGFTSKVAAKNLNISIGTVVTYIDRIRKKLHVTTQKQLVLLLKQHALGQHILDYFCSLIGK